MAWIVLFVMIVVLPAFLIWQVCFGGFVPKERVSGVVVRYDSVTDFVEDVSHRARRWKSVHHSYAVVSYASGQGRREARSLFPSGRNFLPVGSVVDAWIGADGSRCVVCRNSGSSVPGEVRAVQR